MKVVWGQGDKSPKTELIYDASSTFFGTHKNHAKRLCLFRELRKSQERCTTKFQTKDDF
jgi:hypothetical protein